MAHPDSNLVPAVSMDDEVGIVYLIETAQQFWSGEPYPLDHCVSGLIQTLLQNWRMFSSFPVTSFRH